MFTIKGQTLEEQSNQRHSVLSLPGFELGASIGGRIKVKILNQCSTKTYKTGACTAAIHLDKQGPLLTGVYDEGHTAHAAKTTKR
jgi:hypothetical protein